jgi:hypothetical protein
LNDVRSEFEWDEERAGATRKGITLCVLVPRLLDKLNLLLVGPDGYVAELRHVTQTAPVHLIIALLV